MILPDTSVEMTFLDLIFVAIVAKVEWFCLIWGIYARFAKNMVDSSQLILSLTLGGIIWIYETTLL